MYHYWHNWLFTFKFIRLIWLNTVCTIIDIIDFQSELKILPWYAFIFNKSIFLKLNCFYFNNACHNLQRSTWIPLQCVMYGWVNATIDVGIVRNTHSTRNLSLVLHTINYKAVIWSHTDRSKLRCRVVTTTTQSLWYLDRCRKLRK